MSDQRWTSILAKKLVNLISEQLQKGRKELEWRLICNEFCRKTKMEWNVEQLKNQYAVMRKQYLIVKSIFYRDDFSWRGSTGVIVTTDESTATYVRRLVICPTYEELCIIFSNSDDGQETSQPTKPNSSNSRKRERESDKDATYTIADCIKGLDGMHGLEEDVYFGALKLFNEPNSRETFLCLKVDKRYNWLKRNC